MHRPTASYLLVALLAGAPFALTAERLKVQVVQTHTGIKLGPGSPAQSGDSDPSSTQCNRHSGADNKDSAVNRCGSAVSDDPAPSDHGNYMFFDISVVMPDATRAVFHCSTVLNETCEGFPEYPRNTSVVCSDFVVDGRAYKDCTASASSPDGIGVYQVALHGDRLTLFGPHWHRHYLKYGTWEYPDPAGQDTKPVGLVDIASTLDSKPAAPQEPDAAAAQDPKPVTSVDPTAPTAQDPQPATPQEPKTAPPHDPSTPQDTHPATAQDTQPPTPQEPKPAPPQQQPAAAQDGKAADPAESKSASTAASAPEDPPSTPTPQPVAVADLPVDPTVVEQAKAGDQVAQYKLGYDYYLGRGVALDYVQAAIWWRKSADQGYPAAQNNLGVLYNAGKGVPQSYEEAYFWQNLAAARASAGALQVQFAKNRDESASRLWLFERRRVQKRAAQWAADHPVPPRSQEPRQARQ